MTTVAHPIQVSKLPPPINLWEDARDLYSYYMNRYCRQPIVREIAQLATSLFCGYVGTKISEVPINFVSKSLNICGLVDREGWIYLNAPGIGALGGMSYVIFKVTNKIFGPAVNPNGTKKSEVFTFGDSLGMAGTGFGAYFSAKFLEMPINILKTLSFVFNKANADAYWSTAFSGVVGGMALWDGLSEKSNPRLAKAEIVAGGIGVSYAVLRTLVKFPGSAPLPPFIELVPVPPPTSWDYFWLPVDIIQSLFSNYSYKFNSFGWSSPWNVVKEIPHPNQWSWTYLDAQGLASRSALMLPMQVLSHQILGKVLNHSKVPEVVRTGIQIVATAANIVASAALADYLELPGASLKNPWETFKSIAVMMGIFQGIGQGVPYIADKIFGLDEPIEDVPTVDPALLLGRNIYLIPQNNNQDLQKLVLALDIIFR